MTQRQTTPSEQEVSLQVDVRVIKSQMVDLKRQTDRIETKLDGLSVVTQDDFKKFVQYVEETFVKQESLKGFRAVGLAVVTALAISVTLGISKLLGVHFQ